MPLDPQAQSLVDAMAKLNLKPIEDSTPEEARESMRSRTAALGPFDEVAAVSELRVPVKGGEIAVRLYKPSGAGPHPALVFYHGGGWVIGDLYTHDGICRALTNVAGCVVASVDYRLAPEAKYPVAAEDSYAALEWIVSNAGKLGIDARRSQQFSRIAIHLRAAAGAFRGALQPAFVSVAECNDLEAWHPQHVVHHLRGARARADEADRDAAVRAVNPVAGCGGGIAECRSCAGSCHGGSFDEISAIDLCHRVPPVDSIGSGLRLFASSHPRNREVNPVPRERGGRPHLAGWASRRCVR